MLSLWQEKEKQKKERTDCPRAMNPHAKLIHIESFSGRFRNISLAAFHIEAFQSLRAKIYLTLEQFSLSHRAHVHLFGD